MTTLMEAVYEIDQDLGFLHLVWIGTFDKVSRIAVVVMPICSSTSLWDFIASERENFTGLTENSGSNLTRQVR